MTTLGNNNVKQNMEEFQRLRGIAVIGVLLIHTTMAYETMPLSLLSVSLMAINVLTQFAVPLFIFISGYALFSKYHENFDLINFYKKRMNRILIPLISFFCIYYIYNHGIIGLFSYTAVNQLLIMHDPFHFWFFEAILGIYLFYPQILAAYRHLGVERSLIVSFIIQLLAPPIVFLNFIFYFTLGMVASHQPASNLFEKNYKPLISILYPFFVVTASSRFLDPAQIKYIAAIKYFALPIFYASLIIILWKLASKTNFLESWGKYSFGIFIIHVLFMQEIGLFLRNFGVSPNDAIAYPALFVLMAICSYSSIYILSHIPYVQYICGVDRIK
jgi:surface polysaccharide O-acyltransferase-like enzyme